MFDLNISLFSRRKERAQSSAESTRRPRKSVSMPQLSTRKTGGTVSFLSKSAHSPQTETYPDPHPSTYPPAPIRKLTDCDAIDHLALKYLFRSCSCIDFSNRPPPTRCLDLGCGSGAWVVEAANEWRECQFVGFDHVKTQITTRWLPAHVKNRIKWVHGNFLHRLPFEDGHFDHVNIRHIARGVPEHKWDLVIAEVARVLKVGGSVEVFEEDIIFPILPRSSTAMPLRQRQRQPQSPTSPTLRRVSTPRGSRRTLFTQHFFPTVASEHDHAVLENLFYRVFERRFINVKPTALILGTLNIHLHGAVASPLINFPLPAAPRDECPAHTEDICDSSRSHSTTPKPTNRHDDQAMTSGSLTFVPTRRGPRNERPTLYFSDAGGASYDLLPEERLRVTADDLGLHLRRSWQGVMACQEAMWDEYQAALQRRDPLLDLLEWEDHELNLSHRHKFNALMKRYQTDMETHYPMAKALVSILHWNAPPPPQLNEEERERNWAIAEARRDALRLEQSGIGAVPERSRVCRKARLFVGYKPGDAFGIE